MGAGRVAPPAVVAGKRIVWRAEIRSSDENGRAAGMAPLGVVAALYLEAGAAAQAVVEQGRAQSSRLHSIALAVQIPIAASPTFKNPRKNIK